MRLWAAVGAFLIVLGGCKNDGTPASVARKAPFLLVVPYFTTIGDIRSSKSLSVYRVDGATGDLTLAPGSPFASGRDPATYALAPDGRFAYVIGKGSSDISAYRVDAATAALAPVPGSPYALDYSSSGPNGIVVDPAGKFAYAASDAGTSAFSIDATTGALAPVRGSPFGAGRFTAFGTRAIAVDPSERFAYVPNDFSNNVSTYSVDARGALKRTGSPVESPPISNDPGSSTSVTIDPTGKFLYVAGPCCIYIYAIDAATGSLAPFAHLRLGTPGDFRLVGFAIDPTGRFAYAVSGNRVYAYTIDATTGRLKALEGRRFAALTGADPYRVTIDPTGNFAYVFNRGSRAAEATISAYRIDPTTGTLTPLTHSPFRVVENTTDPIARWFEAGRCPAFRGTEWSEAQEPPVTKRGSEDVVLDRLTAATRGYFYDAKSHVALHYPETDSGGTFTLRVSAPPPAGVPRHDLSKLQTTSGIKLGSRAQTVVSVLGTPKIMTACNEQRYAYLRDRQGEPLVLEFTISGGRVTEIFEDFGG